jgi:hypothetical protein
MHSTYLEVCDAPVGYNETATEEETSSDVPWVWERGEEGHGAHLPIVTECSGTQQQPTVEGSQVAECEEPAGEI